jgi:ABC-type antimicrobial peptide transport system permease subunit
MPTTRNLYARSITCLACRCPTIFLRCCAPDRACLCVTRAARPQSSTLFAASTNSEQVIFGDQTMESILSDSMASRRFAMILLSSFAALALVLACVGIYGVMAYTVSQRTLEVGIRMALGAARRDVVLLVIGRGARLCLVGVAFGLASTIALTRLMGNLLFNISPTDPGTLAAVGALLIAVALAACLIPARRAASVDPMQALRTE